MIAETAMQPIAANENAWSRIIMTPVLTERG
jgi:hypothetical protein